MEAGVGPCGECAEGEGEWGGKFGIVKGDNEGGTEGDEMTGQLACAWKK